MSELQVASYLVLGLRPEAVAAIDAHEASVHVAVFIGAPLVRTTAGAGDGVEEDTPTGGRDGLAFDEDPELQLDKATVTSISAPRRAGDGIEKSLLVGATVQSHRRIAKSVADATKDDGGRQT